MIENNKMKFAILGAVIVILFMAAMTAAQTPTCSNKWMEISTGVMTPGPLLTPGMHKIWVGKKVPPKGTIANWRAFGPFQVDAGTKYLLIMTNGKVTGLLPNDVNLNSYSNPGANMAAIYYQSKTTDGAWYAICTQTRTPTPPSGMVSWWDGEGNGNDIHGTNNGTRQGGATFAPGVVGQAFSFNGSSGSVMVPDSPSLDLTTAFTLEAWINPASLQRDPLHQGGIISKVGGLSGNNGYQFGITRSNSQIYCQFNAAGEPWPANQLMVTLGSPIPVGAWTHVACTYDHANLGIYVNGTAVGSKAIGPKSVVNSASNLRISGDDNSNVYFSGRIDEPSVYNRALSVSEIRSIYDSGSAGKPKLSPR